MRFVLARNASGTQGMLLDKETWDKGNPVLVRDVDDNPMFVVREFEAVDWDAARLVDEAWLNDGMPFGYPEHDKLRLVKDKSQSCYDFVEWLEEKGIVLALRDELLTCRAPRSMSSLLAEFFEIDEKKLEQEKSVMLEEQRRLNDLKKE